MADTRDTQRLAALTALEAHRWWAYRACAPDDDNPAVTAADPTVSVLVWLTADQETQTGRRTREQQALTLCGRCPLQQECRTYALGDEHGPYERWDIWGGMTAHQRDQHRHEQARRRDQQQATTTAGGDTAADLQVTARDLTVLRALAAHRTPRSVAAAAGLTVARANWHRAKLVTLLHLDPTTTTRLQLLYAAGNTGLLHPRSQVLPDHGIIPAIPSRQARSALLRAHGKQLLLPGLRDYIRLLLRATTPPARTGRRRPMRAAAAVYGEQLHLPGLAALDHPTPTALRLIPDHQAATDADMAVAA